MSMNDEDKDKWVDDLLAQLPAPKPVPQDISEQLDHFLADHISTLEAEARANGNNVVSLGAQRSNRFTSRYQLLVAAAAVLGILTFAGIQTSFFTSQPESSEIAAEPNTNANQPTPIPEESASQESDTTVDQESANKPTPKSEESISAEENNGLVDPEASSSEIQVLGSEGRNTCQVMHRMYKLLNQVWITERISMPFWMRLLRMVSLESSTNSATHN